MSEIDDIEESEERAELVGEIVGAIDHLRRASRPRLVAITGHPSGDEHLVAPDSVMLLSVGSAAHPDTGEGAVTQMVFKIGGMGRLDVAGTPREVAAKLGLIVIENKENRS